MRLKAKAMQVLMANLQGDEMEAIKFLVAGKEIPDRIAKVVFTNIIWFLCKILGWVEEGNPVISIPLVGKGNSDNHKLSFVKDISYIERDLPITVTRKGPFQKQASDIKLLKGISDNNIASHTRDISIKGALPVSAIKIVPVQNETSEIKNSKVKSDNLKVSHGPAMSHIERNPQITMTKIEPLQKETFREREGNKGLIDYTQGIHCNNENVNETMEEMSFPEEKDEVFANDDVCDLSPEYSDIEFDRDIKSADDNIKKSIICTTCGLTFKFKSAFKTHEMIHTGEKPFTCSFCGKRFNRKGELNRHEWTHTREKSKKKEMEKLHSCSFCVKKFNARKTWEEHERTHTGEKPFCCTQCGKTFSTEYGLKIHERTHTGDKPYSCTQCDKKFTTSSHLLVHTRTHTGVKPYSCSHCDFKCRHSQSLKIHVRYHHKGDSERKHCCSHCNKKFKTTSALKIHVRTHTGEKPYFCSHCGNKYRESGHLKVHHKNAHKGLEYTCKKEN